MTALHDLADDCCCVEDLQAVVQACVDQLIGFQVFVAGDMFDPSVTQAMEHESKVCCILQDALEMFAELHKEPDAYHQAIAVSHVTNGMR